MRFIFLIIGSIFIISCDPNLVLLGQPDTTINLEKAVILGDSLIDEHDWNIPHVSAGGCTIDKMILMSPDVSMYEKVYIHLGVNNILRYGDDPDTIKNKMDELISRLNHNNIYIISVLPSDDRVLSIKINPTIDGINKLYSEYKNFLNINDILDDENGNNIYTRDGLHLNDEGYAIFANYIYSNMRQ